MPNTNDHSTPEPIVTKAMTLDEAYNHLYQLEKFDWEDEAQYAARKVAREEFEKNLADAGLTIQALVSMGHIKSKKVKSNGT